MSTQRASLATDATWAQARGRPAQQSLAVVQSSAETWQPQPQAPPPPPTPRTGLWPRQQGGRGCAAAAGPHLGGEQHGGQGVQHDEAQLLAVGFAKAKGPGAQQEEGHPGVEDVLGGAGEGRLCGGWEGECREECVCVFMCVYVVVMGGAGGHRSALEQV